MRLSSVMKLFSFFGGTVIFVLICDQNSFFLLTWKTSFKRYLTWRSAFFFCQGLKNGKYLLCWATLKCCLVLSRRRRCGGAGRELALHSIGSCTGSSLETLALLETTRLLTIGKPVILAKVQAAGRSASHTASLSTKANETSMHYLCLPHETDGSKGRPFP